jgi:hypothetical protein
MMGAKNVLFVITESQHFSLIHMQNLNGLDPSAALPCRMAFVDSLPGALSYFS